MRRYTLAQPQEEATVDLTPMLDVVFIMLIFFIVTATFVSEVGLDLSSPEPQQQLTISSNEGLLLSVSADNRIYLEGRQVDIRRIGSVVRARHAESPLSGVVIEAQQGAASGTYVTLADEVMQAVGGLPVSLSVPND